MTTRFVLEHRLAQRSEYRRTNTKYLTLELLNEFEYQSSSICRAIRTENRFGQSAGASTMLRWLNSTPLRFLSTAPSEESCNHARRVIGVVGDVAGDLLPLVDHRRTDDVFDCTGTGPALKAKSSVEDLADIIDNQLTGRYSKTSSNDLAGERTLVTFLEAAHPLDDMAEMRYRTATSTCWPASSTVQSPLRPAPPLHAVPNTAWRVRESARSALSPARMRISMH